MALYNSIDAGIQAHYVVAAFLPWISRHNCNIDIIFIHRSSFLSQY